MSVHVEDVFMSGKQQILNIIKEKIKEKFNISESGNVKNFPGFYYEWGRDAKGTCVKLTMDKGVNNIV